MACLWLLPPVSAQSLVDHNKTGELNKRILVVAQQSAGKQMWHGYGLSTGKLGCAASLSNILKQSGLPYAKSAAVVIVRKQLLSGPVRFKEICIKNSKNYGIDQTKLAQLASPGDLIMGYMKPPDRPNLGPDAHCGVIAGNSEVYANDWLDGIWKRDGVDRFFAWYPYIYIIKCLPKSPTAIQ